MILKNNAEYEKALKLSQSGSRLTKKQKNLLKGRSEAVFSDIAPSDLPVIHDDPLPERKLNDEDQELLSRMLGRKSTGVSLPDMPTLPIDLRKKDIVDDNVDPRLLMAARSSLKKKLKDYDLKTDRELVSIFLKTKDARKLKKQAQKDAWNASDKQRTIQRKSGDFRSPVPVSVTKHVVVPKQRNIELPTEEKEWKPSKEAVKAHNKANSLARKAKKKRRKATKLSNRAKRAIEAVKTDDKAPKQEERCVVGESLVVDEKSVEGESLIQKDNNNDYYEDEVELLISSLLPDLEKKLGTIIVRYPEIKRSIVLCIQLLVSDKVGEDMLAIRQFIYGLNISHVDDREINAVLSVASYVMRKAKRAMRRCVQGESLSGALDAAGSFAGKFLRSNLFITVRDLIFSIISLKWFPKEYVKNTFKWLGTPKKKLSMVDAIKSLFKDSAKLLRAFENGWELRSLSAILMSDDPMSAAEELYQEILFENEVGLYYGPVIKDRYDATKHIEKISSLHKSVDMLLKTCSAISEEGKRLKVMKSWCVRQGSEITLTVYAKQRVAPLQVIVFGDPGIGKSSVLKLAMMCQQYIYGRPWNEGCVYSRCKGSQYDDGYDMAQHKIIKMSELGSQTSAQAARKLDEDQLDWTSLGDDLEMPVNRSAVDEKHKVRFMPEMVIGDTNREKMNFDVGVSNGAAFIRRNIYIAPRVLPQYRKEGSMMLDPESGGDFWDKWSYRIYYYDANGPNVSDMVPHDICTHEQCDSLEKFLHYFGGVVKKHMEKADRMRDRKTISPFDPVPPVDDNKDNGDDDNDDNQSVQERIYESMFSTREKLADLWQSGTDMFINSKDNILGYLTGATARPDYVLTQTFKQQLLKVAARAKQRAASLQCEGESASWKEFETHLRTMKDLRKNIDITPRHLQALRDIGIDSKITEGDIIDIIPRLPSPIGVNTKYTFIHEPEKYADLVKEKISTWNQESGSSMTLESAVGHAVTHSSGMMLNTYPLNWYMEQNPPFTCDMNIAHTVEERKSDFVENLPPRNDTSAEDRALVRTLLTDRDFAVDFLANRIEETFYDSDDEDDEEKHVEGESFLENLDVPLSFNYGGVVVPAWASPFDYVWQTLLVFIWLFQLMSVMLHSIGCAGALLLSDPRIYKHATTVLVVFLTYTVVIKPSPRIIFLMALLGYSFFKQTEIMRQTGVVSTTTVWEMVRHRADRLCVDFMVKLWRNRRKYQDVATFTFSFVVGTFVFIKALKVFRWGTKKKRNVHGQSTSSSKLDALYERCESNNGFTRIVKDGQQVWNNAKINVEAPRHTGGPIISSVEKNQRYILIEGVRNERMRGLGLCGSLMLMNRHGVTFKDGECRIYVSNSNTGKATRENSYCTILTPSTIREVPGYDWIIVHVKGVQFQNILCHIISDTPDFSMTVGNLWGDEIRPKLASGVTINSDFFPVKVASPLEYKWINHAGGACGSAIMLQHGKGWSIVGIHCASEDQGNPTAWCFGTIFTRAQIESVIAEFPAPRMMSFPTITREEKCVEGEGKTVPSLKDMEHLKGVMPSSRSPVLFEDIGPLDYYGKVRNASVFQSSNLTPTPFRDEIAVKLFDAYGHVQQVQYGRPVMKPTITHGVYSSPWNETLKKWAKMKAALNPDIMRLVVEQMEEYLFRHLDGKVPFLSPFTLATAINGGEEDDYFRGINVNTGGGFFFPGKKKSYLTCRELENGQKYYDPKRELVDAVVEILEHYDRGEACFVPYVATLKDEARKLGKDARVFFASDLAQLLVQRMYLGPIYSTMVEHCKVFRTSIGQDIVQFAHIMQEDMDSVAPNDRFEGDFGNFDTSMPIDIAEAANKIVYDLAKRYGYNTVALRMLEGVLSDNISTCVDLIGDIFVVYGLQPSGKYGTAEDNSIRNLLIQLYVWNVENPNDRDNFFDVIKSWVYGDDMLGGDGSRKFNQMTLARVCRDKLGMPFTDASKKFPDKEYTEKELSEFLKRNARFHSELGLVIPPLDLDSIIKMVSWRLPSNELSEACQMEATCLSALHELVLHDNREAFATIRKWMLDVALNAYGEEFKLPTYDYILENRYMKFAPRIVVSEGRLLEEKEIDGSLRVDAPPSRSLCNEVSESVDLLFGRSFQRNQGPTKRYAALSSLRQRTQQQIDQLRDGIDCLNFPYASLSARDVRQLKDYRSNAAFRVVADVYITKAQKLEECTSTLKLLDAYIARLDLRCVVAESREVVGESLVELSSDGVSGATVETEGTLTDVMGKPDVEVAHEPVYPSVGGMEQSLLSEVLERPIYLGSIDAEVGQTINSILDPWNDMLLKPYIRSKLRNYSRFKADLKIRIAISGCPFHYGKVLISWQPLAEYNLTYLTAKLANFSSPGHITYLSQSPDCVVMDLTENMPAELLLPYISPKPQGRLYNEQSTAIGASTNFLDFQWMGELVVRGIGPVRSSTEDCTGVSLSVYGWFENVELGPPTGTKLVVGESAHDERVSGPANVSSARRASESIYGVIPKILKFAKASANVLSNVAQLAVLFGFSAPVKVRDPMFVKNEPYQSGVNMKQVDTSKRLTMDPQQELNVDPRKFGSDTDDMAIQTVAARESLLESFIWTYEDVPLVAQLYTLPVTPILSTPYAAESKEVWPLPCMVAALPFKAWHGEMTVRLEIVASKLHRGKLLVYWEPNGAQNVLIDGSVSLNTQFVTVVDLEQTHDVEFTIPWAGPRLWLPTRDIEDSTSRDPADNNARFNGYVGVKVFTALQSPLETADVQVNVYVRFDKLLVNYYCQDWLAYGVPAPPSLLEEKQVEGESLIQHQGEVTQIEFIHLSPSSVAHDEHFGELITSFKACLNRFVTYSVRPETDAIVGSGMWKFSDAIYPINYPPSPTVAGARTLFDYLRRNYVGMRGGTRHRLIRVSSGGQTNSGEIARVAAVPIVATYEYKRIAFDPLHLKSAMRGTELYVLHTNCGVEFEVPYYSVGLFQPSFWSSNYPPSEPFSYPETRSIEAFFTGDKATSDAAIVHDIAAGEDFMFFRFQGGAPLIFL